MYNLTLQFKFKAVIAAINMDCLGSGSYFIYNYTDPNNPSVADEWITLSKV